MPRKRASPPASPTPATPMTPDRRSTRHLSISNHHLRQERTAMTDTTPSDVQATPQTPAGSTPVDSTTAATETTAQAAGAEESRSDWFKSLPPDAQAEITKQRQENAEWRKKTKEADALRKAEEAARLQQEQQAMIEQGKFKELADRHARELEALKPRAERLDAIEAAMRETVARRVETLPEMYRTLVPEYDDPLKTMQWLDANAAKLAAPRPPQMDSGAPSDRKPVTALSDEERQFARAAGMTEDQFREYKAKTKVDAERRAELPKILQA